MISVYVFQSTHPRGVRPLSQYNVLSIFWFQSTHPRGVRLREGLFNESQEVFQSTHPRGVRPSGCSPACVSRSFQSTHPRGVRLSAPGTKSGGDHVSIHAPTRGATNLLRAGVPLHTVSIHAPTRGATCLFLGLTSVAITFQSTHPRGVRPDTDVAMRQMESFNPRTHEGCD